MKAKSATLLAMMLMAAAAPVFAQDDAPAAPRGRPPVIGPIPGDRFKTQFIRLGQQGEGMLYEPTTLGPKSRIAVIYSHPGGNNFNAPIARELANRGYRVMNVNFRGDAELGMEMQLPTISLAVGYIRSQPGVQKVVIAGHSGGGHQMALYDNVAEHGPSACSGPEKIYPCKAAGLEKLNKPDGIMLIDPPLGAFHEMSSIDPAVDKDVNIRNPALDMYAPANGFDAKAGHATYSADFAKTFYAAQSVRNMKVIAQAQARMKLVNEGKGLYANDEPFVVPGLGSDAGGSRLYQSDLAFVSHSKAPHLLLKADGTRVQTIIKTVRPASVRAAEQKTTLGVASQDTTLRGYLSHAAIRTMPNFAITEDDIVGVDWASAYDSSVGNAPGITVPALVMTMGCHYLIVPGEITYDHLASKDKTYATVEGATHGFGACKPEYGDTTKTTFDFVDEWLSKDARF